MSPFRVLLVDDFKPWREFLSSALENYPLIKVVGEASDGLAAIRAAKNLKPDLVLLDVGLSGRNGLEVAREILSHACKVLFVTQESSIEIMQEALSLGAQGYLLKADAGLELLAAVGATLQNKIFVSSSFTSESGPLSDEPALAGGPTPTRH